MAILSGINTQLRGSAGDWTFSQVGGKTVAKQKVAKKAFPVRTLAIMRQRMQWANLVNVFRAFGGNDRPSFQNRPQGVSDFNMFIQANLGTQPVYLLKSFAEQGGALVADYQVTRGSLPSIEAVSEEGMVLTDVSLGSLTIGASTTVKDFAKAVVENNDDFAYGDQITCFIAVQAVNNATQVPYLKMRSMKVVLDGMDEDTLLYSLVSSDGFASVEGKLGSTRALNGGIVWVHSRATQSGTLVSTQRFVVNNPILTQFQGEAALQKAITTYGGLSGEQYLTPAA